MTIGEKIKELRKERGLTQEVVASALAVSRQAVAKWESGRSVPGTDNLLKLSGMFGVPLEELVDAKQREMPALEEYARRKLEEERTRGEMRKRASQKGKELAVTAAAYAAVYAVCRFLFYMAGVKNCVWHWMQAWHVLPATCALTAAAVLLDRKITGVCLFLGTVAAIAVANVAGVSAMQRSPVGYNNGWVFYLATVYTIAAVGWLVERKAAGGRPGPRRGWRRAVSAASRVFVCLLVLGSTFLAVRRIQYGMGAEEGYTAGFAAGAADAQAGKPMNSNRSAGRFPAQYEFGTAAFKGYAVHWSSGYKSGYGAFAD